MNPREPTLSVINSCLSCFIQPAPPSLLTPDYFGVNQGYTISSVITSICTSKSQGFLKRVIIILLLDLKN